MKIKVLLIILLSALSLTAVAQVKKIAILETVDKENKVSYAHKLMLRSNLAKAITNTQGYEGYDRTDMEQITGEQKFQRTGMVSDEQIKKLGEMTGAQYILVAEAVIVDENTMFITAKILNVETAKMEMTDNCLMGMSPSDIQHGCESLANKLLGNPSPSSLQSPQKTITIFNRNQKTDSNESQDAKPQVEPQTQAQQPVQSQPKPIVNEVALSSFPVKTFPDGTKGIVFYMDENNHGLAVSLDETNAKWQDVCKAKDCRDVASVPNEDGEKQCTYNLGSEYTAAIRSGLGLSSPAVTWCLGHGNGWYLPSAGELWYMLSVANNGERADGLLSDALRAAGGEPLDKDWYWSSTEQNDTEAVNVSSSGWITGERKISMATVRAR